MDTDRILVIDDSALVVRMLSLQLSQWGYKVSTAASGQKGLETLQQQGFELVLSDISMPDLGGIELLGRIKTLCPDLPVIMLSSSTETDTVIQAVRQGAFDYVIKGQNYDALRSAIERALEHGKLLRENQRLIRELKESNALLNAQSVELKSAKERLEKEIAEKERMEGELRLAQKLEAVGQLAAGIAHEINTPMQYIGDSVHFLKNAFEDVLSALERCQEGCAVLAEIPEHQTLAAEIADVVDLADIPYLQEKIPRAFERTLEGVERVTTIVQAMKEFAHPDQKKEKSAADINKAVSNALVVASNEYKYVADIKTELADLPPVMCHLGELNQVFLNLVVNAAHAVGDVVKGSDQKGLIQVRTRAEEEGVLIEIQDSGCGIPQTIRERVFDPFFTTKPVGKGTGQGLAIARNIIVEKHGGTLSFESEVGKGTTFQIRIPYGSKPSGEMEAVVQ